MNRQGSTAAESWNVRHPSMMPRQRGAALLVLILLVLMTAGIEFLGIAVSSDVARSALAEKRLTATLNRAREALIARAVAHPTRPGAFPCPDSNNDGIEDALVAGECPSYIGRIPYVTLGIGDLRDDASEVLWYAVSPSFRDAPAVQINSDTHGSQVVHSGSTATIAASEAVAVVFAPGAALAAQLRDGTAAQCPTTATTIARNLCAANYLDSAGGDNNASASGPYIAAQAGATFNDRLVLVRTSDVIPLVEQRVARELRRVLATYQDRTAATITSGGCNCYPWPDGDGNGSSNVGTNRGRIPLIASPHNWGTSLTDKLSGTVYTLPTLPPYFQANNWHAMTYYAVGRHALQNAGQAPTACTTCTNDPAMPPPPLLLGTLSIDGTNGFAVVLITPGAAASGQTRSNWAAYIDDAANKDNDDRFITPTSRVFDRDRLFALGDEVPPASCSPNAQLLVANAPCGCSGGECWDQIKAECVIASRNLKACAVCYNVGQILLKSPCDFNLTSGSCQSAIATLRAC